MDDSMCESLRQTNSHKPTTKLAKGITFLSMKVPPGKKADMRRILKPLIKDARGLARFIHVTEATSSEVHHQAEEAENRVPNYTVASQELSAPALAVMLFVPDHPQAEPDAVAMRQRFLKFPWRFHHSIQLQRAGRGPNVMGEQEFYFLSRQLPLWNVSTGIQRSGLLVRFNLFVRRFSAMVEFYRLITNSEMESKKAGFCLFPLDTGPQCAASGEDKTADQTEGDTPLCELALKHCPLVNPFPLTDAYLTFPVRNIQTILNVLHTQAKPLSNDSYLVHDPDGNSLILYERQDQDDRVVTLNQAHVNLKNAYTRQDIGKESGDKVSEHSSSSDSGRCSDFEPSSFELENTMSQLNQAIDLLKKEKLQEFSFPKATETPPPLPQRQRIRQSETFSRAPRNGCCNSNGSHRSHWQSPECHPDSSIRHRNGSDRSVRTTSTDTGYFRSESSSQDLPFCGVHDFNHRLHPDSFSASSHNHHDHRHSAGCKNDVSKNFWVNPERCKQPVHNESHDKIKIGSLDTIHDHT